jgi:oxygen-independent coproporphyrinogen-3 oxidase
MDLQTVSLKFGSDYSNEIYNSLEPFLEKEWININEKMVTLTREGKLFADHIASELFFSTN